MNIRLAILGAGGHIGRSLALECASGVSPYSLDLYTREPDRLRAWIERAGVQNAIRQIRRSEEISAADADVIINLVGAGDPRNVAAVGTRIRDMSHFWDRKVMDEIQRYPRCRYIHASSGVATGHDYIVPRQPGGVLLMPAAADHYALTKAELEARHREASGLFIYDIRIFSFISPVIPEDAAYLSSAVFRSLRHGLVLETDQHDVWRDYADAETLLRLFKALHEAQPGNGAIDLYSRAPVSKFDLLRECENRFGLTWRIIDSKRPPDKSRYFSLDHGASDIGYSPPRSSIDVFMRAVDAALPAAKPRPSPGLLR